MLSRLLPGMRTFGRPPSFFLLRALTAFCHDSLPSFLPSFSHLSLLHSSHFGQFFQFCCVLLLPQPAACKPLTLCLDSLVASSTPYKLLILVLPGATPRAWIPIYHNAQVCSRRHRGAGRRCRCFLAHGVSGTCWSRANGPGRLPGAGFASHARYSRIVR